MPEIVTPAETQTIGEQIKGFRQARSYSLRQLAQGAGVSAATLSRWETGQNIPGMTELDAVLRELEASPAQKRAILRQMQTPRAVLHLRSLDGEGAFTPFGGDLLWAMRQRKGWTQTETARAAGVTQAQIARWEHGDTWPKATALHTLCWCLDASPDEVAALTRYGEPVALTASAAPNGLHYGESEWDNAHWVDSVFNLIHHPPPSRVMDLQTLVMEQRLMALAETDTNRREFAMALLADLYAIHARHYVFQGQLSQAARWAERGLFLVQRQRLSGMDATPPMNLWFGNVLALASAARQSKRPARLRYAVRLLNDWLPAVPQADGHYSWGQMTLATTLVSLKRFDEAIRLGKTACENADALNPYDGAMRWRDFAQLLLSVNQPAQAVTALSQSTARWHLCQMPADGAARHHFLSAECLIALKDKKGANDHFCAAERLISDHALAHLQPDLQRVAATVAEPV